MCSSRRNSSKSGYQSQAHHLATVSSSLSLRFTLLAHTEYLACCLCSDDATLSVLSQVPRTMFILHASRFPRQECYVDAEQDCPVPISARPQQNLDFEAMFIEPFVSIPSACFVFEAGLTFKRALRLANPLLRYSRSFNYNISVLRYSGFGITLE